MCVRVAHVFESGAIKNNATMCARVAHEDTDFEHGTVTSTSYDTQVDGITVCERVACMWRMCVKGV